MRKIRTKRRITQKQLADMIGVSQSYISKIENGNIESLTIGKLMILSKALGTKPEHLLHLLLKKKG